MLVLSRRDVETVLDPDRLVDAVGRAMADLSAGSASVPNRTAAEVEDAGGVLIAMPAYLPSEGALAAKLVSLFPGNAGLGLPTHHAVVATFDRATGAPTALLDGELITAMRTAACSALSAKLLAREDAAVLAVLGTGVQARAHARALPRVRGIREIRVAGRDPENVAALARELDGRPCDAYHEAVEGADIVCACTHSPEPVVRGAWLRPGAHVTSVGFNPSGREVDAEAIARSLLVVESRAAALAPYPAGSNDLLWAIRDGAVGPDPVHAEIGELVAGTRPGRTSPEEVTLYKSVGVAAQDAAAAALVLEAARASGVGTEVQL
ncbi:MAG TPA: ornithine cyclodeaminase family protein [Gaiellales bacterium]|jgi:ornithine cyclodeaminase/alanine dehydrogenase-like protein (mu-crystallin family)|nr:ornithine cyclodeaminase family protein [Gaiellales bacterium]